MLNKIALYFGLQYKPSSVAEWKQSRGGVRHLQTADFCDVDKPCVTG